MLRLWYSILATENISVESFPLTNTRDINGWVESFPLTNMRDISSWVESVPPPIFTAEVLFNGEINMEVILHGFYTLKDSFFELVDDPYLKSNKDGNRPFYYCIEDVYCEKHIYWMIPLSSKVEKYKAIIEKKKISGKPCDGLYVCNMPNGKESVFLIQDIFPVTEVYIEREYTLGGRHLVLPYKKDIDVIEKKAKKVMSLVNRGIKLTPTSPDIKSIISKI